MEGHLKEYRVSVWEDATVLQMDGGMVAQL